MPTATREVTYCYTVHNIGNIPLTTHSLTDNKLGILLTDSDQLLLPGETYQYITSTIITTHTSNVAHWTAVNSTTLMSATATSVATVTVTIDEQSGFMIYLPLVLK